jgi:hypothetical protein
VERLKNVRGIICANFGTGRDPINDMEPIWVAHDFRHWFCSGYRSPFFLPSHLWPEPTLDEGQTEGKTRTHCPSPEVSNRTVPSAMTLAGEMNIVCQRSLPFSVVILGSSKFINYKKEM